MKFLKRYRWPLIAGGTALLVAGFLLFRPDTLFVDDVVDESLAEAFATTAAAGTEPPTTPTTAPAAPVADEKEPPVDAVPVAPTTTVPQPSEPVAAATGSFFGIDHTAEGTATVYEQDGRYVLRFEEDTDIQNGPDLFVWLLESDEYDDPGAVIDLGRLKGNVGGQNYELPPEYDPDVHRYVLVWCKRFATPFAAAPLA